MKDLAKLLKKREKPPGPAPQEWLFATKLPVSSGSLFMGDPYYDPADAYVATVPPGTYRIEAQLRDLGGEWYTARVRAVLEDCDAPKLGKKIGDTCTDLAVIAFYDLGAANEAIAGDNDLYMDRVTKKSFATCGLGHHLKRNYRRRLVLGTRRQLRVCRLNHRRDFPGLHPHRRQLATLARGPVHLSTYGTLQQCERAVA